MKAYCDSSYDEKKRTAGIGIVIQDGNKRRTYSNWFPARSNNEGELFAIYISAILMNGRGTIYTDSQTALMYLNGEIKEDKMRSREQWLTHKQCKFWAYKIRLLLKGGGGKAEKIKAHTHHFQTHSIGNRLADLMAKEGRSKFYERGGRGDGGR